MDFDEHVRAEFAGLCGDFLRREEFDESFDEGRGEFRRRGVDEGGPPPFFRVGVEGKLRDDDGCAADVLKGKIGLSRVVFEDSHLRDFLREPLGFGFVVAAADAEENDQPASDFREKTVFDGDAGFADALDEGAHRLGELNGFADFRDGLGGNFSRTFAAVVENVPDEIGVFV